MKICNICNVEKDNIRKLSKHIRDCHKIKPKDYYDMYIKINLDDKCIHCDEKTKFTNLGLGYKNFCSYKCATTYNRMIQKNDPEKEENFRNKVKLNQINIWKERSISGEKDIIIQKSRLTNKKNIELLTVEQKKIRFGWLNKLTEEEKIIKVNKILNSSLFKFYKNVTTQQMQELLKKRELTRIKNGNQVPISDISVFNEYSRLCRSLTEKTYRKYKYIINPLNLKRGKNTYHLDHKISILYGFLNNISPDILANICNLEILAAYKNSNKSAACSININELINLISTQVY